MDSFLVIVLADEEWSNEAVDDMYEWYEITRLGVRQESQPAILPYYLCLSQFSLDTGFLFPQFFISNT